MSPQKPTPRRRWLAALAIFATAALAIAWMVGPRFKPLTALEQRLVGQWSRTDVSNPMTYTFFANRRHSVDDQFVGIWSISNGQLYIQYWSKNPPSWYRRLAPKKDELNTAIKFDGSSDRIELGSPTDADHTFLKQKTKP